MYDEILAAHAEKFREKLMERNLCLIKDLFVKSLNNIHKAIGSSWLN